MCYLLLVQSTHMIQENVSLKSYNTFRVDAVAHFFAQPTDLQELVLVLQDTQFAGMPKLVLGGGSNILFTKDFEGLVLHPFLKGIEIVEENEDTITLGVGAGENWHEFVMYAVERGWSGIENLAYIPGCVGGAPVQNIAAYGQTFEDVLISLEAIALETGELRTFNQEETEPAYRSSIFKTALQDKYLVTSVTIQLSKIPAYDTHYHGRFAYESLEAWLRQIKEPPYAPKDVAEAIVLQRKAKLPEVTEYGTCGSFFVNPFVTIEKFHELEKEVPELQHYPITKMEYDRIDWHDTGQDDIVKIPAGRLLEELGWKGKWIGNVGTFDKHALIVVTNGDATGQEIFDFTEQMKQSVKDAYDVELISEVRIVN